MLGKYTAVHNKDYELIKKIHMFPARVHRNLFNRRILTSFQDTLPNSQKLVVCQKIYDLLHFCIEQEYAESKIFVIVLMSLFILSFQRCKLVPKITMPHEIRSSFLLFLFIGQRQSEMPGDERMWLNERIKYAIKVYT